MSSDKQSSVRWILEELEKFELGTSEFYSKTAIINHADRMHKEQIVDAATWGALAETGEQYYNEKYKK